MPFLQSSINAIWKASGGTLAVCYTCKRACKDGWYLDTSHKDHTKGDDYDNPNLGVLECLWCHLARHLGLYYLYALQKNKRRLRETKYSCIALSMRILAGEDRYDRGPTPRSKSEIKQTRKDLAKHIEKIYRQEKRKNCKCDLAEERFFELINIIK